MILQDYGVDNDHERNFLTVVSNRGLFWKIGSSMKYGELKKIIAKDLCLCQESVRYVIDGEFHSDELKMSELVNGGEVLEIFTGLSGGGWPKHLDEN